MKKSIFSILLCVLLVALLVLTLGACAPDDSGREDGDPEGDGWVPKDPDECYHYDSMETDYTPPTCEEDGIRTFYCYECESTFTEVGGRRLGHEWPDAEFAELINTPDCKTKAMYRFTCQRIIYDNDGEHPCGEYYDEEGDFAGHGFVYNTMLEHNICSVCDTPELGEYSVYQDGLIFGLASDEASYYVSKCLLRSAVSDVASVTIPATVNGLPVTFVDGYAFEGCGQITELVLPESVTVISTLILEHLPKLTFTEYENGYYYKAGNNEHFYFISVIDKSIGGAFTLHEDTVAINCHAFWASELSSIEFPMSVRNIGYEAFGATGNLTHIDIPNGVTSIGSQTFDSSGIQTINIPSSVTEIGDRAFRYSHLKSIDLPNVTIIRSSAFNGCTELETVNLGNKLEIIQDEAFRNCSALKIVVPDSVTNFMYECLGGIKDISMTAAQMRLYLPWTAEKLTIRGPVLYSGIINSNFNYLEELVIHDSVTRVMPYAITDSPSLKSITFGDGVSVIEANAFMNCASLDTVIFSDNLREIAAGVFVNNGCGFKTTTLGGLTYIGNEDNPYFALTSAAGVSGAVALSDGVVVIEKGVFDNASLTSLTLADSVRFIYADDVNYWKTGIGNSIDGDIYVGSATNPKMVLLSVASSVSGEYKVDAGVRFVMPYAFSGCAGVTSIVMDDGVLSVKERALLGPISATVTLPSRLGSLGGSAAQGKEHDEYEWGKRDESLGYVGSINAIPEGVVYIGSDAKIKLPADNAYINEGTYYIGYNAFAENAILNEYEGAYYIGTRNNPYYALIKVMPGVGGITIHEDTVLIAERAFLGRRIEGKLTIPDSVLYINDFAFWNRGAIQSRVIIGSGVLEIGDGAFEWCSGTNFDIGENVCYIGERAFAYCEDIDEIYIPGSVYVCEADIFMGSSNYDYRVEIYTAYMSNPKYFDENWPRWWTPETGHPVRHPVTWGASKIPG